MARGMQKELRGLQRFAGSVAQPPRGRKWVAEEMAAVSESKEVSGDLISTEAALEQVGVCLNFLFCSLASCFDMILSILVVKYALCFDSFLR
jgi:hypothetical protein